MTDSLNIETTPLGWTAYYDPEGLTGEGNTEMEAVSDLLEKTDERLGEVTKELREARKSIAKAQSEVERLKDPLHPDNYEGSTLERLDNLVHELTGDEGEDDSFTVLRRRWVQLRTELRDHVVTPVINTEDYDEPTLTGWCCLLCDAEAEKRDALPHDMGCELYEAPK